MVALSATDSKAEPSANDVNNLTSSVKNDLPIFLQRTLKKFFLQ